MMKTLEPAENRLGSYSAETALKGFYKVFLLIASPQFLMQRASKIFTTFYNPSQVEAEITGPYSAILRVVQLEDIDEAVEYRIAGWIKKALELANCREAGYEIKKSMAKGDAVTEIHFSLVVAIISRILRAFVLADLADLADFETPYSSLPTHLSSLPIDNP